MTTVQKWTGRETRALREALCMGTREFAARLGITERNNAKLEALGQVETLRPSSQAMLDTMLASAPQDARTRFETALESGADREATAAGSASPSVRPSSAAEFTTAVERHMHACGMSVRATARAAGYSDHTLLSKVLNGHKPITPYLAAKLDRALSANGEIIASAQAAITEASAARNKPSAPAPTGQNPVQRRTFVGLTGASMISALFAEPTSGLAPAETEPLASVLTGSAAGAAGAEPGPPADIATLTAETGNARRQYQACRYTKLASQLPGLLARLHSACLTMTGDAQSKAFALSADAHHVAAGLLLKLDDQGLAYLAADRSMRAAQASEDPVTIGASARIITHTLMNGRHLPAAVSAASGYAARLDHDMSSHTPESLSVYGALVLRGAIAAAQDDKRGTAHELLNEAGQAAQRLGADVDGNLCGTAFGPANVVVHRVNVAVTLGDAGTAIDTARGVDLGKIAVTERKATLLIDVARAYLQWGRHEKAYLALRAAEATAHEEVSGRPSVHRLVRELVTMAPPGIQGKAAQFAEQIGVTR